MHVAWWFAKPAFSRHNSTVCAMTRSDLDEPARTAAIDFSRRLASHWQRVLGTELLGAYLIGSLAHAGFNRRYSDIDIALVTTAGLSQQVLDRLRSEALVLRGRIESVLDRATMRSCWVDQWFLSTMS
jgi:hypothetical protein